MRMNRSIAAALALSVSASALALSGLSARAQEARGEPQPVNASPEAKPVIAPEAKPAPVQPLPADQRVDASPLEPVKAQDSASQQVTPATADPAAAKKEALLAEPGADRSPAPQIEPPEPVKIAEPPKAEQAKTEPPKTEAPKATAQATIAVDPLVATIKDRLGKTATSSAAEKEALAALVAYYGKATSPLFVTDGAFNKRADATLATLREADDWGLEAKAFALPAAPGASDSAEAKADAEIKLGIAAVKYARFASGGRVDPTKLSKYMDVKPRVADPDDVVAALAKSDDARSVLTGYHPKHPQFTALRQALLKLRAPAATSAPAEPVAAPPPAVKLPEGPSLKPGAKHEQIALLRQRLSIAAEQPAQERVYDQKLVAAVKAFQEASNLEPTGVLNAKTRKVLNGEQVEAKVAAKPTPAKDIERVVLSMERWRWEPAELGDMYVWDNIPEMMMRVVKGDQTIHKEKIIVGKTNTQTPIFSARMQYVVFHPEWGVPDSIKVKEILPYLRRPAQDGGFFGFGGGGADTRVLQRHNLRVSMNGKPIDASKIDWATADIRQFQFIQPSGGSNMLGVVKFRFPNKHDVYMHDTPQRELFNAKTRTFSHGCMRVHKPQKLAEVLLAEDQGMSAAQVAHLIANPTGSSYEITLKKQIPVHVTYMTASVDESGKLETYADIYGHDSRLTMALSGKQTEFVDPEDIAEKPQILAQQANMKRRGAPPPPKQEGPMNFLSALFGN